MDCPDCHGAGYVGGGNYTRFECEECGGTGKSDRLTPVVEDLKRRVARLERGADDE